MDGQPHSQSRPNINMIFSRSIKALSDILFTDEAVIEYFRPGYLMRNSHFTFRDRGHWMMFDFSPNSCSSVGKKNRNIVGIIADC